MRRLQGRSHPRAGEDGGCGLAPSQQQRSAQLPFSSASRSRGRRLARSARVHAKTVSGRLIPPLSLRTGVESFEVDLPLNKVTVRGNVTPEAVLERVSKTGKETALWTS